MPSKPERELAGLIRGELPRAQHPFLRKMFDIYRGHAHANPWFELYGGILLQWEKMHGRIINWYPSRANSPLDMLKVDMVVLTGNREASGVQIASGEHSRWRHQKSIRNLFGNDAPVSVVPLSYGPYRFIRFTSAVKRLETRLKTTKRIRIG